MGENKHLTPVWIVYVDGKRLDTDHEGALERIVIDDKLNGVGTGVLEFDSSMIKIRDSGTFSLESYVSVHLGYKDDCEQVFAGEVTEFKGDFSEYGHERVKVVCKNCLHKLQNAYQSRAFEEKRVSDALKERLESYGLKGEIEDFGAVRNYFVESGLSDYEYLLQTARKYGKTVYGYDDTVYIKDEVTVSDEEVILEWGKSLISFRCSENLKGQLSSCTFVGWDENNCEGITGSAGLSDIPVKVGGDSSWEDNSKGASGTWKAVFTADDLYDNEDAKNRAIGYLQNISMEYQTGVGKCEGNRHIFPGMRVTIKYVGEHFSGEYIAERVVHEVSVNGPFTTEVYVKRNMTAGGASHVPGAELAEQEGAGNTETEQAAAEEGDERAALYKEEVENVVNVEIDNTRVLPRYFQQRYFSEKFGSDFGKQACAATSLLNELSEQYTLNTGLQMTDEQADAAMQAAVNSGNVSDSDANVNNWAGAANAMWSTTGQRGSFVYGGDNPTAIIYAEDKDQNGKAEHFTNSNGSGTYYDPINGNTGTVGDTPLQNEGLGNTRTLTYQSGEE